MLVLMCVLVDCFSCSNACASYNRAPIQNRLPQRKHFALEQTNSSTTKTILNKESLKQLDSIITRCTNATSTELTDQMIERTGRRISPRTIRRVRTSVLGRHPVHEQVVQSLTQGHYRSLSSMRRRVFTPGCSVMRSYGTSHVLGPCIGSDVAPPFRRRR